MVRQLAGWLLAGLGALGLGLTGLATALTATSSDHLASAVVTAICMAGTVGCLGGAWLLLRRRGMGHQPARGWEPHPGEGWLPQQAWAELPDVLPERPRLGSRPPGPSAGVPPDGLLRRLWLVRAELAFDQAGGMRTYSLLGWIAVTSLSAGLALLLGAFLATGRPTGEQAAAVAPILGCLIGATVVGGGRASRNPRRHVGLRRLQRELQTAYAATPGGIPAGPTVRLGDPTPRYHPGQPPDGKGSWSAGQ